MPTKSTDRIRINGGGDIQLKIPSGSWVNQGKIVRGYEYQDDTETIPIDLAGGEEHSEAGKRPLKLVFEVAQTDKEAIDYKDTVDGKVCEVWFDDGIVNSKHIEFYGKAGKVQVSIMKKDGDAPQKIKYTVTFAKQAAAVSVADTALPTESYAATGTYTGVNNYGVWIETAVS